MALPVTFKVDPVAGTLPVVGMPPTEYVPVTPADGSGALTTSLQATEEDSVKAIATALAILFSFIIIKS